MNPMTLAEYLELNKIMPSRFAKLIGVTDVSVSRYLAGRIPDPKVMKKIIKVTKGKVTADSFYSRAA